METLHFNFWEIKTVKIFKRKTILSKLKLPPIFWGDFKRDGTAAMF